MKFVELSITVFWLLSGLSMSVAGESFFKTPAELSDYLKTKTELGAEEYRQVRTSIEYFDDHSDVDRNQAILLGRLAGDKGAARFMKLRETGDLQSAMDLFHTQLRSRILEILQDGKDPGFSARVLHEAMERKQWWVAPIYLDMELKQGSIYDELMGGPETRRPYIDRESSPAANLALKKALEEKWPLVLKGPATVRERKPPVQGDLEDTGSDTYTGKDSRGKPGRQDDTGITSWLIGILALLAVAIVVVFIKNRRMR